MRPPQLQYAEQDFYKIFTSYPLLPQSHLVLFINSSIGKYVSETELIHIMKK